jgi:hypothetical protein
MCEKRKLVDTTLCCVIHVCLIEVPREAVPLEEFFNETIEHTSLIFYLTSNWALVAFDYNKS